MADPFDRLLERTMKAGASAPEPCPSAELLGAYVDGALPLPERHAIERHAADCQTCAEHLALLSGLEPVSSPGAAPKAVWWRSWTWLVPVAATVLVAAVWVSLPREAQVPTAEVDRVASSKRSAPEPQNPSGMPVGATASETSHTTNETASAPAAVGVAAPKLRKQTVPSTATAPRAAEAAQSAMSERRDQPAPPSPPPAVPVPATPATDSAALKPQSADLKDKADEEARQRAEAPNTAPSEGVAAATSTSAASAPAGALPAARRPQQQSSGFLAKTEGKRELAAVSQIVQAGDTSGTRWRLEGPTVKRSTDGGITWQDTGAPALPGASFMSAPTADVCWVAAPSGDVILRTSDGKWTRSRAPAPSAVIGLTATSATNAIVTIADQRRFETKDGAVTWVPLVK